MKIINSFFGTIMMGCYSIWKSYGGAIILFTVAMKIIMLPISIMVQKNSIKMVKMYPELNRIKARCFGDKDMISEQQYDLYKKENYHPLFDLIPVIVQLILLVGAVNAIYGLFETYDGIERIGSLVLDFSVVPVKHGGWSLLVPLLAALSAWLMCFTQNIANVLQSEQSKANKLTTLSISVGLSLYLGLFVAAGVGFYWIVSNLTSILLMYILNYFINPKKFIDYEELEQSKKELAQMLSFSNQSKKENSKEEELLEKKDYKRFFQFPDKQIVFYAERNGFYKYFKDIIEYILKKTDIIVHYVTSDPKDEVLSMNSEYFRTYYIGDNRMIPLMMKMDADIVAMTTPDLQKYHMKKSIVRNDIEYVYIDHGIGSCNLMLRKHALDAYDTVFVSNEISMNELRAQERTYQLKERTLVPYGYCLIDNMIQAYERQEATVNDPKKILIAPSWQEDNLIDLCIDDILKNLLDRGYHIILRPHPQYVRHFEAKLLALQEQYKEYEDFELQMDFSSNDTVFNADILMTDWSGIAYEYSFTTLKPSLFINTPMKVMNPDYEEIGVVPFDIEIRDMIGISVEVDELDRLADAVSRLLHDSTYSSESMKEMRNKYLYHVGTSAKVGADYLINSLIRKSQQ